MKRASFILTILIIIIIIMSSVCFAQITELYVYTADEEEDFGGLDIESSTRIKYDEEDNNYKMLYTGEYYDLIEEMFGFYYNESNPCSQYFSIDGDLFAKNVGSYRIKISLRDKENYKWYKYDNDEGETFDTEDVFLDFEVYENSPDSIKKPKLSTRQYRWSGNERNVSNIFGYDSNYMKISGNYKATEIGQYTYTVSLKNKNTMKWDDGTTDDITGTWKIIPIYLKKPSLLIDKFQFNSRNQTILLSDFDEETMKIISGNSAWLVGNYQVRIALKDSTHYAWRELVDGEDVYTKDDIYLPWSIVTNLENKWQIVLKDGKNVKYPYDGKEKNFTYKVEFYKEDENVTHREIIDIDSVAEAVNSNVASEIGDYYVEYKLLYPDSFVWVDNRRGENPTTSNRTIKYSIVKYENQGWLKLYKYCEDDKLVFPYTGEKTNMINKELLFLYVSAEYRMNDEWFPLGGLHPAYEITGDKYATEPGDYQITFSLIDDEKGDLIDLYDCTNSEEIPPTPQKVRSYTINWKIVDNYEEYIENLNKPESEDGDLNNDDAVNIIDVKLLLQKVISNQSGTWNDDEISACDINKDNAINIIDVKLLLQKVINKS